MKNSITFLKKGLAVLLVVLLVSRSVEPAHASISAAAVGIAISIVALAQQYGESASVQEREEIRDLTYTCFTLKSEVSGTTVTDGEHLHEMYLELCNLGFPCEIREEYINGSWYYCIVGNGYVDIPKSFLGLVTQYLPIHDRVYTNSDGIAYVSNYKPTSNNYLQWSYEVLQDILKKLDPDTDVDDDGVPDDGVAYWANQIYWALDYISKQLDNLSISGGGSLNVTPIVDKLQDVIDALDVTPIVDKLQTTIDAADERLTLLLSDLGGHVSTIVQEMTANTESIVDAIPDPVDLQPVNDRIDAVVEEVRKISTFSDLNEIVTVTPGVLGDVEVVTDGDWLYEDLTFYYEPDEGFVPDGSQEWSLNTDNIWVEDDGSGFVEHITWDFNTWGGTDVSISLTDDFYAHMEDIPEFYLEFVESGGYTVFTVSMQDLLSGTLYYSVYNPADIFCIRVVFPANAYVFQSGMAGFDLLTFKYGSFGTPMTSHLSFTVDGVPHTLYWWNEYEFVSDGTVWSGIFLRYTDGHWYLEDSSGTVWPVLYYDAYLTDALTSAPTTTTTIEGGTYTWFEWFYTSFKGGGSLDVTPIVSKLKDIENALANMGSDIDIENNTNINISEENENYNIFYVDDPDGGEDKSIVDLSGDTLKVFGKLLDFLYKVSFKGSLDNAGSSIGDLSDFYLDTSEGSADLWAS